MDTNDLFLVSAFLLPHHAAKLCCVLHGGVSSITLPISKFQSVAVEYIPCKVVSFKEGRCSMHHICRGGSRVEIWCRDGISIKKFPSQLSAQKSACP